MDSGHKSSEFGWIFGHLGPLIKGMVQKKTTTNSDRFIALIQDHYDHARKYVLNKYSTNNDNAIDSYQGNV